MEQPHRLPRPPALAGLLCAALLVPVRAAQETPPAPAEPVEVANPELARDLKRLLHLTDGRVLRARARLVAERWEVRSRGEWRPLPAGLVLRHKLERDALSQARELEDLLAEQDPDRRVALADWLASEGLLQESFEQLDRVLRSEPDHPLALETLDRLDLPLDLPSLEGEAEELQAAVDALIRAASPIGPAAREVAIGALAGLPPEFPLQAQLEVALAYASSNRRRFAAHALRRLFTGELLEPLIMRSILDPAREVREAASLALKATGEEAVVLPALRALRSSSSTVRVHAAESLGILGQPAAVPALMSRLSAVRSASVPSSPRVHIFVGKQLAYIQDFDVEVAQFQAVADPQVNTLVEGAVLDVRVLGVQIYTTPVERATVRTALRRITGAHPGNNSRAWQDWYEQHKSKYLAAPGETHEQVGASD